MSLALIGRSTQEALASLRQAGETLVRVVECLPPEDKRRPNARMRVLRVQRQGETVVLTVSPFEVDLPSDRTEESEA